MGGRFASCGLRRCTDGAARLGSGGGPSRPQIGLGACERDVCAGNPEAASRSTWTILGPSLSGTNRAPAMRRHRARRGTSPSSPPSPSTRLGGGWLPERGVREGRSTGRGTGRNVRCVRQACKRGRGDGGDACRTDIHVPFAVQIRAPRLALAGPQGGGPAAA